MLTTKLEQVDVTTEEKKTPPCAVINEADAVIGKGGVHYHKHGAFCLETQKFPDAVHHVSFVVVNFFKREMKAKAFPSPGELPLGNFEPRKGLQPRSHLQVRNRRLKIHKQRYENKARPSISEERNFPRASSSHAHFPLFLALSLSLPKIFVRLAFHETMSAKKQQLNALYVFHEAAREKVKEKEREFPPNLFSW
jgi:hypothetical protein